MFFFRIDAFAEPVGNLESIVSSASFPYWLDVFKAPERSTFDDGGLTKRLSVMSLWTLSAKAYGCAGQRTRMLPFRLLQDLIT